MKFTPPPFTDAWPMIFTDLDGSLLDHHSYSHDPARTTLDRLEQIGVAVIPTTSKTFNELIALRETLANRSPFIVENGAAIYIPAGYFPSQPTDTVLYQHEGENYWRYSNALPRQHWQQLLAPLEGQFAGLFTDFNHLGDIGIANATGLSIEQAKLANQRDFSEPVYWGGSEPQKEKFIHTLRSLGTQVVAGGRFLHLMDPTTSKGAALRWLSDCYRAVGKHNNYMTIAVGDSHNDISMLEAADLAVIIRSPIHQPPQLTQQRQIVTSNDFGPTGWSEVINNILALG